MTIEPQHTTMPDACILIVDDIRMNIYVAEELLSPYKLKVETALSGFDAIEKIKQGKTYDIIFMDHLMPEMDGIETTKRIRDLGYTKPIIALTANTLSNQEDFFQANGIDALLSKPIEINNLDLILNRFICKEKRTKNADCEKPIDNKANEISAIFVSDAQNSVNIIEKTMSKSPYFSEDDWQLLNVNVHAMKTALAIIGEKQLSAFALKLEEDICAKCKDIVIESTPQFIKSLKQVIEKKEGTVQIKTCNSKNEDTELLQEDLQKIATACEIYDKRTAKHLLNELNQKIWSAETKKMLDEIQKLLWDGDFEKAMGLAKNFSK